MRVMRVRRALSLAIDRWTMADTLSNTTYLKFVGGIMRPGFAVATPEAELATLPGLSHDGVTSRAEARRLLAAAKVPNLSFALVNRDVAFGFQGDYFEIRHSSWRSTFLAISRQ